MSKIQIKGIREGLLVVLGEGDWLELRQALLETVAQRSDFLRGARIYLDVGNQILHAVELGKLRDELSEHGLTVWGVLSNSPKTELTAQSLGLATRLSRPSEKTAFRNTAAPDTRNVASEDGGEALLVRRTLRSGYQLKYAGHVVVMGDVNPGAEIIAGGCILVWGALRGSAHAGAEGDEQAVICALDLSPTQLRIATSIALPPQRRGKIQPEMACLRNGQVIAEGWEPGKGKSGGIWPRKS